MSEYIKLNANKEPDRVIAKALIDSKVKIGNKMGRFMCSDRDYKFMVEVDDNILFEDEILIPYDSAKLDPRLLIGEDVPVEFYSSAIDEWELESWGIDFGVRHKIPIRIPKQWLKERGMLEGE